VGVRDERDFFGGPDEYTEVKQISGRDGDLREGPFYIVLGRLG
jgi:hypothetical protein